MKPKFIGFGLARITKAIWEKDNYEERIICCPYRWIIYSKMGLIDQDEGKIDKFWSIISLDRKQRMGIKRGPYGYVIGKGGTSWRGIDEEEFNSLLKEWINERETA